MPDTASEILELPAVEEPVALRLTLRSELLGGSDWVDRFGPHLGLGEIIWSAWGDLLAPAGMSFEELAPVLGNYRREIWFWVLGDRRWDQVAAGLAGRVLRRLPVS